MIVARFKELLRNTALSCAIPLAACQTVGLPLDAKFPDVPADVVLCSNNQLSTIPDGDLSAHDVEILWKSDRYVFVATKKCLRRLIVRDKKLAQNKE